MNECEQLLHNAILMFACAEFIENEKKYYLLEAKQYFKRAIIGFKNNDISLKNDLYELIAKLTIYLTTPINPVWCKILKTIISFIPNKKLRHKLRGELL